MNLSKKRNGYIVFAAFFCAVCVVTMFVVLLIPQRAVQGDFEPPQFDSSAVRGEPAVPEGLGYSEPYREGMEFRAGLCGNINLNGETADVYFTNKAENSVWLMLRITDESGNVLANTGIIRPGEYVQAVKFTQKPENGQKIICKIMAYEPETYYSQGYFTLKTTIIYA